MTTIYRISVKNLNAGIMNIIFNNYNKYNLNKNSRILLLAIISQNIYILKRVHSILYKAINACFNGIVSSTKQLIIMTKQIHNVKIVSLIRGVLYAYICRAKYKFQDRKL